MAPVIESIMSTLPNDTTDINDVKIDQNDYDNGYITLGRMMFYTTISLIALVFIYAAIILCRRNITANDVKQTENTSKNTAQMRLFTKIPAIHVVDNRSDLEWDMEGLQFDFNKNERCLEKLPYSR